MADPQSAGAFREVAAAHQAPADPAARRPYNEALAAWAAPPRTAPVADVGPAPGSEPVPALAEPLAVRPSLDALVARPGARMA